MGDKPLFRTETVVEIESALSRVQLRRGIVAGRELPVFVACAVALALAVLFVRVSLDMTAVGIFRSVSHSRLVLADRDGVLTFTVSDRVPIEVAQGDRILAIRSFDPVTLRQAPNVEYSRTEMEARRARLVERRRTAEAMTRSRVDSLQTMKGQLERLTVEARALTTVYVDAVERLGKRVATYRELLAKGQIVAQALDNVAELLTERNLQLKNIQMTIVDYERRINELELQRHQALDDGNKEQLDLQNQLVAIDMSLKADAELAEQTVRADRAMTLIPKGFVAGQAIKRGDALFEIHTGGSALDVEVDVPESQVGELREGMPATIGVNSYPYFRYGMIKGAVSFIRLVPNEVVAFSERLPTKPQFRMVIRPEADSYGAFSRDKQILPGMLVEVHVRKRQVAVWRLLFAPLLQLGQRTDV